MTITMTMDHDHTIMTMTHIDCAWIAPGSHQAPHYQGKD